MDSNIKKLETLSLVSLTLEDSQKSFQIQQNETNNLTKPSWPITRKSSQMKVKYEKIKQSKIDLIAELDRVKAEHNNEVS